MIEVVFSDANDRCGFYLAVTKLISVVDSLELRLIHHKYSPIVLRYSEQFIKLFSRFTCIICYLNIIRITFISNKCFSTEK